MTNSRALYATFLLSDKYPTLPYEICQMIEAQCYELDSYKRKRWYDSNGHIHRDPRDGPAEINLRYDTETYFKHGCKQRLHGPYEIATRGRCRSIRLERYFLNDRYRKSVTRIYREDDTLKKEIYYNERHRFHRKDGDPAVTTWHKNGIMKCERYYEHGKKRVNKCAPFKVVYYKNGTIKKETCFHRANSIKKITFYYYDKNGDFIRLKKWRRYNDGSLLVTSSSDNQLLYHRMFHKQMIKFGDWAKE